MKKIISICLMLCVCLTVGFVFVGCGENRTVDDLATYYTQIKETNEVTKQFFAGNKLRVDFSGNAAVYADYENEDSHANILKRVYEPILTASSNFMAAKVSISNLKTLAGDMTQEARNNLYKKLQDLDNALQEFAKIKEIYERSDGTLQFTKLLTAYNKVIDASFELNIEFADNYYLNGIGYKDFSKVDAKIIDADCKDMMYYNNMLLAKIVFDFSVKTYEPNNPLTSINDWYNNSEQMTTYLADYITVAHKIEQAESKQLATTLYEANPNEIKQRLYQMQTTLPSFVENREMFYNGIENFSFSRYYKQTNKEIYLENCSEKEQSYFKISRNFLKDRFSERLALVEGLYDHYLTLCN